MSMIFRDSHVDLDLLLKKQKIIAEFSIVWKSFVKRQTDM